MKLSVIICAHNPRNDYLKRVLLALKQQTLPFSKWELLLVDNASDVPIDIDDLTWHSNARFVHEPRLGLAYARERGINEASYDTIVFVDDDNVLNTNYLSEAAAISTTYRDLGIWGSGDIVAEFANQPSPDLNPILGYVGITGTRHSVRISSDVTDKASSPIGAGICVRKPVALAYCQQMTDSAIKLTGRSGQFLLGCDDYEMSYTACALGYKKGVFPALGITHLIGARRTTEDYLIALVESTQISELLLRYKWLGIMPHNPDSLLAKGDRILNHFIRRGIERKKYAALRRAARGARKIISECASQKIPPIVRIGTEQQIEQMTRTLSFR